MKAAAVGHRPSSTRTRLTAWLILGCAVVLSIALISLATTTTRENRRAVGNGVGRYVDVTTTSDARIAVAAWLALAAGLGAWAVVLRRSGGGVTRVPFVIAAAGIVVTGYLWVASPLFAGDGFSDSERYENVGAVISALRTAGMPCAEMAAAPAGKMDGLFVEQEVCRQPNRADIRDGHDEVLVAIFSSGSARSHWTATTDHDDLYAVIGPGWVTTCEFQATCARIQASIGGRNY
jgi:hypothetical protein